MLKQLGLGPAALDRLPNWCCFFTSANHLCFLGRVGGRQEKETSPVSVCKTGLGAELRSWSFTHSAAPGQWNFIWP